MTVALVKRNGVIGIDKSAYDDLLEGVECLKECQKNYTLAHQYYTGKRPEYFASYRYQLALARTGTTYRMNFAKTPVDAVVDRLQLNNVLCPDQATTDALKKILDANEFDLEWPDAMRRACEFGDAYLIIWPNDDLMDEDADEDEDEATAEKQGAEDSASDDNNTSIDIFYNDPRTMRVIYDDENPRVMKYVIKRWKSGEVWRVNLYYKDRIEKWVTRPNADGSRDDDWLHYDDGSNTWPIENPYGRPPVFHLRTDRPYGQPEHINAYGPQDAITKIVITHMATMDYHGFPQRWALTGGDLDDGDADMEDFGWDEDDIDQDDSGSSSAGSANRTTVRAEPGHLWLLKNIKSVGQFEAAKADVFLGPFDTYVRAMAQLTTTPYHYFDPSGDVPSGESLRVADAPMVKKVTNRQTSFGATLKDACEFILLLMGHPDPEGAVTVNWVNPASRDDMLMWDLAMYKRALGVPYRQILMEAGYTPEQLDEWGVPDAKWELPPGMGGGGGSPIPAPGAPTPPPLRPGKPIPGAQPPPVPPQPPNLNPAKGMPSLRQSSQM